MRTGDLVHAAVGTALAAWLVATAANQLPDSRLDRRPGQGRGRLHVYTPNWRFFGPNPGVRDTHLLYRDEVDGRPTEWVEIPVVEDRTWYGLVWNARNRAPKVLFDASQMIIDAAAKSAGELAVIRRTSGYRMLERYLRDHVRHVPGALRTQFMLLTSYPEGEVEQRVIEPTFAAEWIDLVRGDDTVADPRSR
ncbi:MAG: hypothetical protein HOV94_00705 [Saccharothrix sp.]|nr:hypothetical protein [Saccharothrix sp.]